MDSIKLEFNDIKSAKSFVKRVKKSAKVNKFLTISHLYFLYRIATGTTIKTELDDNFYGWTFSMLSEIIIKNEFNKSIVIMPFTFIKKGNK